MRQAEIITITNYDPPQQTEGNYRVINQLMSKKKWTETICHEADMYK